MAKDRKIDMVILGLLFHENLTGYDIKKRIDQSISFFWKGSFGSIYPSLAAMEKNGLVIKTKDESNTTKREKILYEITDEGRRFLQEWLEDSKAENSLRYETLLKLFFGGATTINVSVANIEAFENDITKDLEFLKFCKSNLEKVLDERDHVFFYLTVSFGVETYEAYLRWSKEAKQLLLNFEK